jgi:exosome complex exonuclease RRP6
VFRTNSDRPIPQIMLDYARSDTHFLLYIYDCMRNELISSSTADEDLIDVVLAKSKETSLQRYEHPIYDSIRGMGPVGWYRLISRTPAIFNREQFAVFRAAHAWRDEIARREDESTSFVMSNHSLFAIAREIPIDRSALFRVAAPVSQPVRLRVDELIGIISNAKAKAETERDMKDVMVEIEKLIISKRAERYAPKDTSTSNIITQNGGPVQAVTASNLTKSTSSIITIPAPTRPAQLLKSSRFWGTVANTRPSLHHAHSIQLTLPLPDLTAEIYATEAAELADTPAQQDHEFVPAESRITNDGEDDVFIVRQLGGSGSGTSKRKRGEDRPELAELGGTEAKDDEEKRRRKQERKKERQRLRREQDEARDAGTNGLEDEHLGDEEEEAFDYDAAPSMITLRQDEQGKKKTKGKRDRFDIYARAIDAPRGLGRAQKGKPGKSTMFKK